jgi:hypothetical protein
MVVTLNGSPTTVPGSGPDSIDIHAGGGDDQIFIDSSILPVNVFGDDDDDTLVLAELSGMLGDVHQNVTFNGGAGSADALRLWDDGKPASFGDDYFFTDTTFDRDFFPLVTFTFTERITLHAQPGDNIVNVDRVENGLLLEIDAGDGDDTFRLAEPSRSLDDLAGPLVLAGGPGTDSITLNDRGNDFDDAWTITADSAIRDFWPGLQFTSAESITILAGLVGQPAQTARSGGGTGANTFRVSSINIDLTIDAGGGDDLVLITPVGMNIDDIDALVFVNGEAGADVLEVFDLANARDDAWAVSSTAVGRDMSAMIEYGTIDSLIVHAGDGANAFTLASTSVPTSVNGGGGDDAFNVADGDVTTFLEMLTIDGQAGGGDAVTIDDNSGAPFNDAYEISGSGAFLNGFQFLAYAGVEQLALDAADGNNTITVSGTSAVTATTVRGNAGADTVVVQETDPTSPLRVLSGAGEDVIQVNLDETGSAAAIFEAAEQLASLSIGAGGRATLSSGGAATLRTGAITITVSGRLDITDNAVIVDYTGTSPLAAIRGLVTSGYNGAGWSGNGITSSIAAATAQRAVGYSEANAVFSSFPATFAGQSVDETAVLLRFTRYGDANLDQTVNLTDFNRLAANFATGTLWSQGNFNFDATVNLSDFNALAANFGQSVAAAAAAATAAAVEDEAADEVVA